jgi:hypothetical protein
MDAPHNILRHTLLVRIHPDGSSDITLQRRPTLHVSGWHSTEVHCDDLGQLHTEINRALEQIRDDRQHLGQVSHHYTAKET